MMTRNGDILYKTEYIKNVLYFAIARPGKVLISSTDTHFFSIDNELIYENYYCDFGPLNLGCVYRYCNILRDKLKKHLNRQVIVHYTSTDYKKKANAAFLLGCYGVLYLSLAPRDALKPLLKNGQSYRPFQDATQGDSIYTISLLDCLYAIKKGRQLDFFNFQDFNYEEYERLDKIQGGDLNWIVPGKFLAFIGPVDYTYSLYHPPEMYLDYFKENNVKIVIRLNKRLYNGDVFNNAGITHYDLFFPDGMCPPRHILLKFLQIAEDGNCAIAVHCKAGLGRTGSLIGSYLIKHYRMRASEAIGWMRICRPGSVIGHQQGWLEQLESWLQKQGDLYRKRMFQDTERIPVHHFGVYSIEERLRKQRPVFNSPPPSPPRMNWRAPPTPRPQISKIREDKAEEDEVGIASQDLTIPSSTQMMKMKGCILRQCEDHSDHESRERPMTFWQKYFTCTGCSRNCVECWWKLAVQCARWTPRKCYACCCCRFFDWVMPNKTKETGQPDGYLRYSNTKITPTGSQLIETSRRISGAGEPRSVSQSSQHNTTIRMGPPPTQYVSNEPALPAVPTFRTSQSSVIKTLSEAKTFLRKSSMVYSQQKEQREKALNSTLHVTSLRSSANNYYDRPNIGSTSLRSSYNSGARGPPPVLAPRRRLPLGRSPSPSPSPSPTRATNTVPIDRFIAKDRTTIRDAFSNLSRKGEAGSTGAASVGVYSVGAKRDAPAPISRRAAPSVRSDERSVATQGDILNSIKFQRRLRDTWTTDKTTQPLNERRNFGNSNFVALCPKTEICRTMAKEKPVRVDGRVDNNRRPVQNYASTQDKNPSSSSRFISPTRPTSPKGRSRKMSYY